MRIQSTFRVIPTYTETSDIVEIELEFKIDRVIYFPLQITE